MIRIFFKETSPLPFREWDIEDGKILRCEPDPEVSWVGVDAPIDEKELFKKEFCFYVKWADGTRTQLDIDRIMRLPRVVARPDEQPYTKSRPKQNETPEEYLAAYYRGFE